MTNLSPDALLTRRQTAAALSAEGFPVAESTLATKATRGGGPPFRLFGRVPLYRWGNSLEWARGQLSPPITSSSEREALRVSDLARGRSWQ